MINYTAKLIYRETPDADATSIDLDMSRMSMRESARIREYTGRTVMEFFDDLMSGDGMAMGVAWWLAWCRDAQAKDEALPDFSALLDSFNILGLEAEYNPNADEEGVTNEADPTLSSDGESPIP